MTLISLFCDRCGGDSHERDHAYKCRPMETAMTSRHTVEGVSEERLLPPVLDACCGPRMMWFDKNDPRSLFIDRRRETCAVDVGTPGTVGRSPIVVDPDDLVDFTEMPYPDRSFSLVVFDPPHVIRSNALGAVTRRFGVLNGDWPAMLRDGFAECFRVLKSNGTLIFKWSETQIPLAKVLALTPERPLFGHKTSKHTRWVVFMKELA